MQDTWKVGRRLTLTYGARWEVNPAPTGSRQHYTFENYADPREIRIAPAGSPLYATRFGNVAPLAGAVWDMGKGLTVRGAFGLFYDLGAGIIGEAAGGFHTFANGTIS